MTYQETYVRENENLANISHQASLTLSIKLAPQVNFACQQNSVAVIQILEVTNYTTQSLNNLTLSMVAQPECIAPKYWVINSLAAGERLQLHDRDTQLDGQFLLNLNERIAADVVFKLMAAGGEVLVAQRFPIEVLARNEWGGYGSSPELLAAFCMPNLPIIETLLRNTSALLRRNGHEASLKNYQDADRARLELQVSALWSLLQGLNIDYAYPPKSFERSGQKIRTPDIIVESRRATCVDLALLMAALLEQMQLNPFIVLEQGHAYVGLWLSDMSFEQVYLQDQMALRKRVDLNECLLIETTLLTQYAAPEAAPSFMDAVARANQNIQNDNANFCGVVDIKCARTQRIRPLSFVESECIKAPSNKIIAEYSTAVDTTIAAPIGLNSHERSSNWAPSAQLTPSGRLAQWQRRLLDLSLRNPLLNMRMNKTTIPLVAPNPGALEDLLAQGKSLAIEALPSLGARDEDIHSARTGENLDDQNALAALQHNKIYARIEPQKLESALVDLYRKARNDLEEGGANTLFLAIGVLYWKKPGVDDRLYRAPLILIPVSITRQTVRSGIKLTLNDDEPRFNTTLLEMLRQDFNFPISGLDAALPTDESGTDIPAILTYMRKMVRDLSGFEVRDEVYVGTFSFAKYLMWKDLVERTAQLKQNSVVRHLLDTPKERFAATSEFIKPSELDQLIDPAELFTPLSADSSQLAAVVASAAGKNFVMIGPPGTGKSQTIANMIAHNLGLRRRVLFVSEKAAALDVVYRRLREQGLGEFCLELHSNKARKLDVLRQLGEAWEVRGKLHEDIWQEQTQELRSLRQQLNELVNCLHQQQRNGLSIRAALSLAAGSADVPAIKLAWPSADSHDQAAYKNLLQVADRLELNAAEAGDIRLHPLKFVARSDWSLAWQQQLVQAAQKFSTEAKKWRAALAPIAHKLLPVQNINKLATAKSLSVLVDAMRACEGLDMTFAFSPNAKEIVEAIGQTLELLSEFNGARAQLSCGYQLEKMLQGQLAPVQSLWYSSQQGWWLGKLIGRYKVRKLLKNNLGAEAVPSPEMDLPLLTQLHVVHEKLIKMAPLLERVPAWCGVESDAVQLNRYYQVASALRAGILALAENPESLLQVRAQVRACVIDANELLSADASFGRQLLSLQQTHAATTQALAELIACAAQEYSSPTTYSQTALSKAAEEYFNQLPQGLNDWEAMGERVTGAQQKLNSWCAWQRVRYEAIALGLEPLVAALERGQIAVQASTAKFKWRDLVSVNYARWWCGLMIDATPLLREFVAVEHEQKIQNFRRLDAQIRALTADYIRTRIRTNLMDKDSVKRASEFGIIRRELEKKTRHKPLRQLMSEAPNAIPQLTPCLLMSPLSIAQYLPVEQAPFDVVIFDEASQITVWDAIGALARGKQNIVAGDPQQLPPTSFFGTAQNVDDESDEEEDLESILDEMLGANLPTINLSWHYRSRHESLISFSNHRYYKNNLVTFPSPVTQDKAVSMSFVGGVYDRGGSQTNRAEADAIVAEIEQRLLNPLTAQHTLGVVTFNQKQQTLILDLLEATRRKNPELERFFAEDLTESVFVKNLESVQGDERDIILFSTTFGPDAAGNITMNFGPLNKNGGERRLNVAVTRARVELKVFASLRAEQIDLKRTAAQGVTDLKHFLAFAEQGSSVLSDLNVNKHSEFDSPLESAVARALIAKGWQLRSKIGVSNFKIELAVVDPRAPENFIAGIECDGSTYQLSATARDRDLVRESVLRALGWNLLRFWSTDFWIDPEGVIEKLDQQLRSLLA